MLSLIYSPTNDKAFSWLSTKITMNKQVLEFLRQNKQLSHMHLHDTYMHIHVPISEQELFSA